MISVLSSASIQNIWRCTFKRFVLSIMDRDGRLCAANMDIIPRWVAFRLVRTLRMESITTCSLTLHLLSWRMHSKSSAYSAGVCLLDISSQKITNLTDTRPEAQDKNTSKDT